MFQGIRSSVVAAHSIADQLAKTPLVPPNIPKMINDTANTAFITGMGHAMLIGAVIMIGAAVLTYIILPAQVIRPEEVPAHGEAVAAADGMEVEGLAAGD
jgi:hypothetical protein